MLVKTTLIAALFVKEKTGNEYLTIKFFNKLKQKLWYRPIFIDIEVCPYDTIKKKKYISKINTYIILYECLYIYKYLEEQY